MICEVQNTTVMKFDFYLYELKILEAFIFYAIGKQAKTTMIEDRISLVILNSSKLTVGEKNQSCHQLLEIVVNEKCSL